MLLKSIKLKNIRSYTEQTILFPENSTLLSGDIGSGKSTLLLAIEFALFGISKPNLTGETLLRKGETTASVELSFQLNKQNITIQRNLKKNKNTIAQTAGHLIINNLKKELTPLEIKTEIIHLLNYPEDLVTKNKNHIFRYTLYCPQEAMKLILQENPDNRLDILRRIFNLDKYKRIRENIFFYLKKIRIKSTVLKTRIEPLEPKKEQLKEFRKKQEEITQSFNQLLPEFNQIQEEIKNKKIYLKETEEKNHLHLQLKNKLTNTQNLIQEKQNQQQSVSQKREQIKQNLAQLAVSENKETLTNQLQGLQTQQQEFLKKKSELDTKLNHCQEKVPRIQNEISQLIQQTDSTQEKEEILQKLKKELVEKEQIEEEKTNLEQQLEQINKNLHQNQFALKQAEETTNKISNLDQCPTCLQEVSPKHKQEVCQTQQQTIQQSEKKIQNLNQQKQQLQKRAEEIKQKAESLLKKENQQTKLQIEIFHLKEKQTLLKGKKEQLQELVKENNALIKELENLNPEKLTELNQQIDHIQEQLQKLIQKQELEKNVEELEKNLKEIRNQINGFVQERNQLEEKLKQTPDLTKNINQEEKLLEELTEKEKELLLQKIKLNTQQENFQQQISSLVGEINQFNQFKSQLNKLTEIHYWLDEFLVKLTYTIEKQVLLKIHYLFNSLFQEWFSILVEDENFSARLDDSFTPVIEQNGYEIYFNNLSGGERTAASLSYRLALNKVINDIIYEIKTRDLLILDEPTDGFSSEQLDKIRDVLEKLDLKQTLIVSHESKIESFVDNVIRINKSEGVSQVI